MTRRGAGKAGDRTKAGTAPVSVQEMVDVWTRGGAVLLGPRRMVYYDMEGKVTVYDFVAGFVVEQVDRPPPAILSCETSLAGSPEGIHYVVASFRYVHAPSESCAYVYRVGQRRRMTDVQIFDNTSLKRPLAHGGKVCFVDATDMGYVLTHQGLYHFCVESGKLNLRLDAHLVAEVSKGLEAVGYTAACEPWVVCVMSGSPNRLFWWNERTRKTHSVVVDVGPPRCMVVAPDGHVVVWGARGHFIVHPRQPAIRLVSEGRRLPMLGMCAAYEGTRGLPWRLVRAVLAGHQQHDCVLSLLPTDVLRIVLRCITIIHFTSLSVPFVSLSVDSDRRAYRPQRLCVDCGTGRLWVDTARPQNA